MNVQCDDGIVNNLHQVSTVLACLLAISLGVLQNVAKAETLTMSTVDDELGRRELIGRGPSRSRAENHRRIDCVIKLVIVCPEALVKALA